uniref:Uncharacterized protein n=1 Tax=Heterorhabditis bacteriophora TaxID=37862 RepID=A0A1I7WH49_HETBA
MALNWLPSIVQGRPHLQGSCLHYEIFVSNIELLLDLQVDFSSCGQLCQVRTLKAIPRAIADYLLI